MTLMVSLACCCTPRDVADVLTAVSVPVVPIVANVSAVPTVPPAVDVPSATGVSTFLASL